MIKCKLCNKDFKNLNALSSHVTKSHKDITQQYYYDTFIRPIGHKNICPTCGKTTDFISIGYGYKTHCNKICSNMDNSIITQRHNTLRNGIGHPFTRKDVLDKCKSTLKEKYNVDNAFQIDEVRLKSHNTQALEKHYQTMKKNQTFKTSKQEDECYNKLLQYFSVIYRNYKTKEYPFRCDFYIPEIDCYIECNFHWTHGGHWFNENDSNDIATKNNWSNKSNYFNNAINTWTIRDVEKRKYAKENKLNYVVLWKYEELQEWIDSNFELRHDY